MKQFFLTIIRNIRRNPLITAINFFGLVLGFVCVIFITVWTKNELSYDRFHRNTKIIYRVHRYWYDANGAESLHLPYVAPPVAPLLIKEFPEIQSIARVYHTDMVLASGDRKLHEDDVCMAEPEILKIFDFHGLPADNNLLVPPFTMIISDETALKYFNSDEVVGKFLEFKDNDGKKYSLQITGVFKKWKGNSHFNPNILISFNTAESFFGKDEFKDWGSNNYETFALIPVMPPDIDKKLDSFIDKYLNNGSKGTRIRLEKLTDIHFNWYGNRSYVYILTSIALLILIIGSINYMNLNAAIYFRRFKEIKIKKIVGASQKNLSEHLLGESVFFSLFALITAVFIASAASGIIRISDNPTVFGIKENITLITGFIVLSFVTGVLSGIYPVLIMSSFKPVTTNISEYLKAGKSFFRNSLVVFQFVVSTGLIICFLIVSRQLNYINTINLGLDKDNIIVIDAPLKLREKLEVFKQQLARNSNILAVCGSKRVPSDGLSDSNGANIVSEGTATPLGFRLANVRIDRDFITTYKIQLIAGRNFNENVSADSGYILNEIAVSKIGWKSPEKAIGQIIEYGGHRGSVIGVVRDFHYESLHTPINPVIMYYDPSSFNRISIRFNPSDLNKTISFIEKIWQTYNVSDDVFTYEFLNDRFERLYRSEEKMRTIFSYFMIVAISIAVLGMLGLSVFLIERRTREIGIRKINGARISEVIIMLNFNFVKWVVTAFVITVPIAYYAMHRWLQSFAYKTELSWWIFALAGTIAVTISLLTVSWQSWRAASGNPAETLRYE